MPEATETRTEKGISLARGPALILGTILLAAGLYFLYKQHFFPKFSNFPNGKAPVEGKVFGIFGANGWTGMLTAVAGGLLLFGAAQHLLAKTISLIVGVALAAAAIIALVSGDVLGLAAANGWTELAWGVAAAILLFNTMIPRGRTTVATGYDGRVGRGQGSAVGPAAGGGAAGAGAAGGGAAGGGAAGGGAAGGGEQDRGADSGAYTDEYPDTRRDVEGSREPGAADSEDEGVSHDPEP